MSSGDQRRIEIDGALNARDLGGHPTEDADEKLAFSDEVQDQDQDVEDNELDEFEALPIAERLEKVIKHLREKYWYCFWCKYRYEDEGMEDCPGLTED